MPDVLPWKVVSIRHGDMGAPPPQGLLRTQSWQVTLCCSARQSVLQHGGAAAGDLDARDSLTGAAGNGTSAARRSTEGGRLQSAWKIAGSGDTGSRPGEEAGWNLRPKPAGSSDAGRKSMEGGELQPAWKPGGSAHAAWKTFEAYIVRSFPPSHCQKATAALVAAHCG